MRKCGCFRMHVCSSTAGLHGASTTDPLPCTACGLPGKTDSEERRARPVEERLRPSTRRAANVEKIWGEKIEQVCTPSCPHPMSRLSTSIGRAHVMPTSYPRHAHVMPTSDVAAQHIRACGLAAWSKEHTTSAVYLTFHPAQERAHGRGRKLRSDFLLFRCTRVHTGGLRGPIAR